MKIYLNGELVNKEDAMVSVFDHGLLYGDGVFEGIRLYDGCIFKLDEHLERLEYSAKAILLDSANERHELTGKRCVKPAVVKIYAMGYLLGGYPRSRTLRALTPDGCGPPSTIIIGMIFSFILRNSTKKD